MIDLQDWQDEHREALSQASEFARRAEKGIPCDRWATERQMHLVAKGIRAMQQVMLWQAETLEAMTDGRK
jgi:post-segregation antitoxin (ccd killing protein)